MTISIGSAGKKERTVPLSRVFALQDSNSPGDVNMGTANFNARFGALLSELPA